MKTLLKFIVFIALFIGFFTWAKHSYFDYNKSHLESISTTTPDDHLILAGKYLLSDSMIVQGFSEIKISIESLNKILPIISDDIADKLSVMIKELEKLYDQEQDENMVHKTNRISAKIFNTLALINLKFSRKLAHSGDHNLTLQSLNMALIHANNALNIYNDSLHIISEKIVIDQLNILSKSLKSEGEFQDPYYYVTLDELNHLIDR